MGIEVPVVIPEEMPVSDVAADGISESALQSAQKDPRPAGPRTRRYASGPAKPRVSIAEKKDVKAKITMMLLPPAAIWGRYDEYCGTAFVRVVPELAEDLAEIFSDSAEVMAWFASGAGWLKYLKLLNTLQPVGEMMWAHHISHTVGEVRNGPAAGPANAPDWDTQYTVPTQQQARTVPSADRIDAARAG
jgi:hypothetical protein